MSKELTKEEIKQLANDSFIEYGKHIEIGRYTAGFIKGFEHSDQNTKPLIDEIAKLKQDLKAAESVNEQYRIGLIEIKHSLTESRQKIIEAITNPI